MTTILKFSSGLLICFLFISCTSKPKEEQPPVEQKTPTAITVEEGEFNAVAIDKENVRATMRSILAKIQKCYGRALKTNKNLEGKVQMLFQIDSAGKVQLCEPKTSNLNSPDLEICVCEQISKAKFPPAPKGQVAEVRYPFVFQTSKRE